MKNFYDTIKNAVIERQVEDVYNEGINLYFPTKIEYPFVCDGFVDTKLESGKILKLIIEYKFNEMLNNPIARAKVLIQVIYYLKKFEQNGLILPNVCMVGDKDECFVMHTNELLKYLDEDVDWETSPSNAAIKNPEFVLKISKDENINPFVFVIDKNFNFEDVANKIKDLAENVKRYVRVTEHNIAIIYDYFCKNVIKNMKKIKSHDLVEIFIGVITNEDEYYQHPTKKNILVTPKRNVEINGDGFKSFFGYFQRNYTPQEKNNFTMIADRLIEDTDRRNSGDFWTPTLFVDYAHKMISEKLGENWRDEYVVWDNCSGSKNLTRDYKFKELYCSTLFDSELKIGERYNKEATSFQFDFLNDEIYGKDSLMDVYGDKLPKGLKDALLENKPIVFLINPPYARVGKGEDGSGRMGTEKGSTLTKVNEQMKDEKIGGCSANLYAQFLYRIMKIKQQYGLTDCHIGLFSPTLFLSGESWKGFRSVFFNNFAFNDAVQFKASYFADVADNWGISFSIWSNGTNTDNHNFKYNLIDNVDGEIEIIGTKDVYNTDDLERATEWVKSNQTYTIAKNRPCLTNGIKITESKKDRIAENALGSFINDSNNVDNNTMGVALFSTESKKGGSSMVSVMQDNFTKCVTLFSARKLIEKNWVNSKDEYLAPNEGHPQFEEFVNDSIVYSLFHSASNQSSLRQVEYKGKPWDIKNEFFWMSKDEITDLSNENGYSYTYNDSRTSSDRYVFKKLQEITLSKEAQLVLNKATEIVRNTFKFREMFDSEHPEYQIMNWDCGWYQIKALAKEYDKENYDEFVKLFKNLSEKMKPMVYTLGFLK